LEAGSVFVLGVTYFVVENIITFTVVNGVMNYEKKDDTSIRTKVPDEKPKIKLSF
jgi:hypothetical protein